MKLLFDFFPVVLFLITYKLSDIYTATLVIIAASVVQVGVHWLMHRRIEKMHLVSLVLFIVLGGLTLYLRDKRFIMWKPTLINWLFGAGFLATAYIGSKPLIQRMLGSQLEMPDLQWRRLNLAWVLFFVVAGAINLVFAQRYIDAQNQLIAAMPEISEEQLTDLDCEGFEPSNLELCELAHQREETWVNVKVFGLLGLTVLFIIGQTIFLMRHMKPEEDDDAPSADTGNQ
jgi:intracellular septation protein